MIDLRAAWPEIFESLTEEQANGLIQTVAAGQHEGWNPPRLVVEALADFTAGRIDMEECDRRCEPYLNGAVS